MPGKVYEALGNETFATFYYLCAKSPKVAKVLVREGESQSEWGESGVLQISHLGVFLLLELAAIR